MTHEQDEQQLSQQQQLDAVRIRQVSRGRRATMRVSSYCLIAAAGSAIAAIDLIWRALRRFLWLHTITRPAIYIAVAFVLGSVGFRLFFKSRALSIEARRPMLAEPATPPDFSQLSDGSQIVKNLENIH